MHFEQRPEPSLGLKIGQRVADIVWHRDYDGAEFGNAILWLLWGCVVANPWTQTFGSSPAFRVMAWIAPEPAWGVVAIVLALAEFYGTLWERRRWRIWTSFAMCLFSVFVGILVGLANPVGTGWVVYSCVGLFAGWAFLRVSRRDA